MPAVTQVNSIRPRYALGVARLPEVLKPTPIMKQRVDAVIGLPGVVGDSGHRKISRGIWETHLVLALAGYVSGATWLGNQ